MRRFLLLLLSIGLHGALVALALFHMSKPTIPLSVSSVPVSIVSEIPERAAMEAPFDPLAVKTPVPEPAPDEPVPPPPTPKPVVKDPVPEPSKSAKEVKKEPEKKGLKPQSRPKDEFDLSRFTNQGSPAKPSPSKKSSPSPTKTEGGSLNPSGQNDAGLALNALTSRLTRLWSPNCDVPGARDVKARIQFEIARSGRVSKGPFWINRVSDPVWEAGAARALLAVKKGELYTDMPDGLYERDIVITFDAAAACRGK
jgi:outer membrane biosynthesis protein TonB